MPPFGTAQNTGLRRYQCDGHAITTGPGGARAYVLLDGVGDRESVRTWVLDAARRLAETAARLGDAQAALRAEYDAYADERRGRFQDKPDAAAVVAVTAPGRPLTVAWCGDARAYVMADKTAYRMTQDHNMRRVWPPTDLYPEGGSRHRLTSALGLERTDDESRDVVGHPAIEADTWPAGQPGRLLLATDGAYEPHEEAEQSLTSLLEGDDPDWVARLFVDEAVDLARAASLAEDPEHPRADNASVIIADFD
jgi:serine/threonine protein phosphatase PrpC